VPNKVIVSLVSQFSPPIDTFPKGHERLNVEFLDGSRVWVNPEAPMGKNWAFALEQLQSVNLPVYIEADPETQELRDLQVPISGRLALLRRRAGGLRIALEGSVCCLSVLRESNPAYRVFEQLLVEAEQRGRAVTLTRRTGEGIIDARLSSVRPTPPRPCIPFLLSAETLPPITTDVLNEMFALVYPSQDCVPSACTRPCIPFRFPDCGCEARAHEMCKLILESGKNVLPGKVFNIGALTVKTANSPNPGCKVCWPCHIAPRLTVIKDGGGTETMIIDPSLFTDGPVTLRKWLSVQGVHYQVFQTAWECYEPNFETRGFCSDPDYSQTTQTLALCRAALAARNPPPPYSCA
jgi:hypothetical protein